VVLVDGTLSQNRAEKATPGRVPEAHRPRRVANLANDNDGASQTF
jgi:hypothetical protein